MDHDVDFFASTPKVARSLKTDVIDLYFLHNLGTPIGLMRK